MSYCGAVHVEGTAEHEASCPAVWTRSSDAAHHALPLQAVEAEKGQQEVAVQQAQRVKGLFQRVFQLRTEPETYTLQPQVRPPGRTGVNDAVLQCRRP